MCAGRGDGLGNTGLPVHMGSLPGMAMMEAAQYMHGAHASRVSCDLQLSHKDDEHTERTIVCSRHNTAVFTPFTPGEDLELDMGVS